MKIQGQLPFEQIAASQAGPVECLGMQFPSDEARRAYFLEKLKEKLQDPEFRKIPGFPEGTDEDILRLSDPPYYTACPNPFLTEFVRVYGRPYDPAEEYHREPLAVDVSFGKSDPLYKAHRYHTKVPYLAIVPAILHYTRPGDVILDGFAGSGMTGVAVQWCSTAPTTYRAGLDSQWDNLSGERLQWGERRAIVGDLSPAATSMTASFTLPLNQRDFERAAMKILDEVERDLGWMYVTAGEHGTVDRVNYTVWSEVFSCPSCSNEIIFLDHAWDAESGEVQETFNCKNCGSALTKRRLERTYTTVFDAELGEVITVPKRVPWFTNFSSGRGSYQRRVNDYDLDTIARASTLRLPPSVPTGKLPYMHMTHERARMDRAGITHAHHFFLPRAALVIGALWEKANKEPDARIRNLLKFWLDSQILNLSIQNCYRPNVTFPYNPMTGVYYVSSAICEANPFVAYRNKLKRLAKAFSTTRFSSPAVATQVADCAVSGVPANSVDYIFTDPPFGENIYYSDLNFLVESWHGVKTSAETEAIIDRARKKDVENYTALMRSCFAEYHRVLKPGRWMTVVFSNSSNAVWRAIQEAIGVAGFVIADVRTLDKKQGSYRQVTSSAMKQDLVISAYKPTEELAERFSLKAGTPEAAWAFVDEHLARAPRLVSHLDEGEVVAERTQQMLLDRMIAFHVQRGITVPLSAIEFFAGLEQRYAKIDGMYFRHDQVVEYNKRRAKVQKIRQLSYQVNDEASAILWVRAELEQKPQSFPELNHTFLQMSQAWAGHEEPIELKEILEQNFLYYDGTSPVPPQIHSYLSTNYKELRGLTKESSLLKTKAQDRWYVPDPNKQGDLEALRQKRLVKEFQEYKAAKKKLKQFRTEAVRAGFKAAYDAKEFQTIIEVAKKLPEKVIQEDDKLLMYYDYALMVSEE